MLRSQILLATGSVVGKDHYTIKKNNQDSYHMIVEDNLVIGTVTDGCGDSKSMHSEVGAKLGARLISNTILRLSKIYAFQPNYASSEIFWERVRNDTLAQIRTLSLTLGDSLTEVVSSFFLFTCVSVLITPLEASFVSIGDGVTIVNEEVIDSIRFQNNEPPYLCYSLLDQSQINMDSVSLKFKLVHNIPTSELKSFLIGSDGINDLISNGIIDQFWSNEKNFRNPLSLSRTLNVLNKEKKTIDWEAQKVHHHSGIMFDDTTMIAGIKNPDKE